MREILFWRTYIGIKMENFIQGTILVVFFRLDQNYNEFYKIRN